MKAVAELFKVLSDEARLQMLWLLFNRDELCVCDIMGTLGITQSKASRHLATLRHAGLVTDRRAGAWSYYSVVTPTNPFDAAILETLRTQVSALPQAADLLTRLDAWLKCKSLTTGCGGDSCCGTSGKGGTHD